MSTYFRHTQRLRFKKFLEAFEIITKRTLDLNQMDNTDPNKFYLAFIKELKLEGKDISDLTPAEITQLLLVFQGQFPSIPRECTISLPSTMPEGLASTINVTNVLNHQKNILPEFNSENNLENQQNISIYPNPTKAAFTLELKTDLEQSGTMFVFNANGQLVKQGIINHSKQEWSTNDLPSGVYYIQVNIENKIFKDKLVVIK